MGNVFATKSSDAKGGVTSRNVNRRRPTVPGPVNPSEYLADLIQMSGGSSWAQMADMAAKMPDSQKEKVAGIFPEAGGNDSIKIFADLGMSAFKGRDMPMQGKSDILQRVGPFLKSTEISEISDKLNKSCPSLALSLKRYQDFPPYSKEYHDQTKLLLEICYLFMDATNFLSERNDILTFKKELIKEINIVLIQWHEEIILKRNWSKLFGNGFGLLDKDEYGLLDEHEPDLSAESRIRHSYFKKFACIFGEFCANKSECYSLSHILIPESPIKSIKEAKSLTLYFQEIFDTLSKLAKLSSADIISFYKNASYFSSHLHHQIFLIRLTIRYDPLSRAGFDYYKSIPETNGIPEIIGLIIRLSKETAQQCNRILKGPRINIDNYICCVDHVDLFNMQLNAMLTNINQLICYKYGSGSLRCNAVDPESGSAFEKHSSAIGKSLFFRSNDRNEEPEPCPVITLYSESKPGRFETAPAIMNDRHRKFNKEEVSVHHREIVGILSELSAIFEKPFDENIFYHNVSILSSFLHHNSFAIRKSIDYSPKNNLASFGYFKTANNPHMFVYIHKKINLLAKSCKIDINSEIDLSNFVDQVDSLNILLNGMLASINESTYSHPVVFGTDYEMIEPEQKHLLINPPDSKPGYREILTELSEEEVYNEERCETYFRDPLAPNPSKFWPLGSQKK